MYSTYEFVDEIRRLVLDDKVRLKAGYGIQGLFDVLREGFPLPSKEAREQLGWEKGGGGWIEWVESLSIPSDMEWVDGQHDDNELDTNAGIASNDNEIEVRLNYASNILKKYTDLDNKEITSETQEEIRDVCVVFIELSYIAAEKRRKTRKTEKRQGASEILIQMGAYPWCMLCGSNLSYDRGNRSLYCEKHDPKLDKNSYQRALRRAQKLMEIVLEERLEGYEYMKSKGGHKFLQFKLNKMWGALSRRVGGLDPKKMQKEFDKLVPESKSKEERGEETRRAICRLWEKGMSRADISRELNLSKARVSVLVKELGETGKLPPQSG